MLYQLLFMIRSGDIQTHHEIATKLQISPALVLVMVNQLVQSGYLQPLSACSKDNTTSYSCETCSSHAGCLLAATRQGWLLTERGEKLISSVAS